jgi:glycine dehydrogenase
MIAIKSEVDRVESGEWNVEDNPLRNAPHTAKSVIGDWSKSYSRELAVYPVAGQHRNKYWPIVRRIDSVYGDRNLVCSCPPPEAFA